MLGEKVDHDVGMVTNVIVLYPTGATNSSSFLMHGQLMTSLNTVQSGRRRDHDVSRMVRRNYLLMAKLAEALLHAPDNKELE